MAMDNDTAKTITRTQTIVNTASAVSLSTLIAKSGSSYYKSFYVPKRVMICV